MAKFLATPEQLKRSWYIFFFQTPFAEMIVPADDFAVIDMLWHDWSPGHRPDPAFMRALKETLGAPGSTEAAISYYRSMLGTHPGRPRARRGAGRGSAARSPVPTLYLHGADDGCMGVGPRRRARAPGLLPCRPRRRDRPGQRATSCSSTSPRRCTRASSASSAPPDRRRPDRALPWCVAHDHHAHRRRHGRYRRRTHQARVRALQIALAANGGLLRRPARRRHRVRLAGAHRRLRAHGVRRRRPRARRSSPRPCPPDRRRTATPTGCCAPRCSRPRPTRRRSCWSRAGSSTRPSSASRTRSRSTASAC